jgi:Iap family predicted aminopeptidase
MITLNMAKAREIQRDRIRALREPLFADLDVAYQRADENGDAEAKAAIAARKQALRDATKDPAIDAAKTPEELKAAIPDALKG